LKKKLNQLRDYIPVNMINASIGGTTAKNSLVRLESQVLKHEPDLVIVCFGLNDVNGSLEDYVDSLKTIFKRCKDDGLDVIFMTPNMLNTSVADDTPEEYYNYAIKTAEMQNGGRMDNFIYSAVDLASKYKIPVCDCYSKWKEISKTHDVTTLLINRINHPTSEMHQLFATSLFDMIIKDAYKLSDVQNLMFEQ
jgi:lysophospholipase L1-like esterase